MPGSAAYAVGYTSTRGMGMLDMALGKHRQTHLPGAAAHAHLLGLVMAPFVQCIALLGY